MKILEMYFCIMSLGKVRMRQTIRIYVALLHCLQQISRSGNNRFG